MNEKFSEEKVPGQARSERTRHILLAAKAKVLIIEERFTLDEAIDKVLTDAEVTQEDMPHLISQLKLLIGMPGEVDTSASTPGSAKSKLPKQTLRTSDEEKPFAKNQFVIEGARLKEQIERSKGPYPD